MPDASLTAQPALQLHGVAKLYGANLALRATYLEVPEGDTLALLGPNGSGKTTLLRIIAGVISPTLGTGAVLGHDLVTERAELRGKIGFLASDTHLYDDLTAEENLRFILTMAGYKPGREEIASVLDRVSLLPNARERVRGFSSGMQRRLSLARLLLLRPRLWLLDEPYNSLDAAGADLVDTVIGEETSAGGTVILATHDAERALAVAGRVAVLDGGYLRYAGSVQGYRGQHAYPA